jgi:hypothetical protein
MRNWNVLNGSFGRSLLASAGVLVGLLSLGCSSSDDGGGTTPDSTIDPKTGLKRCPADPTQQTTDACVDKEGAVLCKANSGYPGDELAMCTPDPTKGMLLHYGPKNYDDPAEVAKYMLPAGGEDENCIIAHTPNTSDVFVRNYHGRMRPNSHHLIVTTLANDRPDSNGPVPCAIGEQVGTRWLLGSQDPQIDLAVHGSTLIPPEPGDPDYGLGQQIKANTTIRFDMHYINSTSQPLLKEGWVYLEYVDQSEIINLVDMITFFQGAISVPPYGNSETAKGACPVPSKRYVGLVTGHFHQNGTRFSVWKRDTMGIDTLIYETYDWEDPGNLWYRDKTPNQPPDPTTLRHGGWSGFLEVQPGESIVYQCAFSNPTDQTITLGELGADQMCNVFGMYYPSNGNVWGCVCLGDRCS